MMRAQTKRQRVGKAPARGRKAYGMISAAQLGVFNPRPRHVLQYRSSEKKNIDTTLNVAGGQVPAFGVATGIVTCLNACTAAATPTSRVGRRICMTSVYIRGQGSLAPTSTGSESVRVIVVYDKQCNKALPGAADILVADNIQSQMLLANSHRFRVVRDILVPCVGTAGPQSFYIDEFVKLNNLETEYIDNVGAGTFADITSGGLFALIYANQGIGTASATCNLNARVRFTDM